MTFMSVITNGNMLNWFWRVSTTSQPLTFDLANELDDHNSAVCRTGVLLMLLEKILYTDCMTWGD